MNFKSKVTAQLRDILALKPAVGAEFLIMPSPFFADGSVGRGKIVRVYNRGNASLHRRAYVEFTVTVGSFNGLKAGAAATGHRPLSDFTFYEGFNPGWILQLL